jgi:hypothetical protein
MHLSEQAKSTYNLSMQIAQSLENKKICHNIFVFSIGSTYANNCSRCDLDYPRLEQTNGKLQEHGKSCHYDAGNEVDSTHDIKNEAPLFSLTKR